MPITRNHVVEHRRVALSEQQRELQIKRGLYITDNGGERYAVPVDRKSDPTVFLDRRLWRRKKNRLIALQSDDVVETVYRPGVRFAPRGSHVQKRALAWLRDNVNKEIPYWYYLATLGHDLHVSTYADLQAQHWHQGWAHPFTGTEGMVAPLDPTFASLRDTHFVAHECDLDVCPKAIWPSWEQALVALSGRQGFVEELGWLSGSKVTDIFVSEEIDELVSATASEYADFDQHRVGTSAQAENNNDTDLITTSGIAAVAGTPGDSDPIYTNAGTITADATETWEEHVLGNNITSPAIMDRSLTGGQAVNSSDQVTYTLSLTKNPEA
jgi:hypothetical protein